MEEDDDASEGSAATEEPTRLWLRRVYLHYASRNDDRNMSSLTLPTFRLLMRDLQVAQQLPGGAVAADVLFHAATRNEARMDFGSFAEALALLARRLYPDLGPKAAFAELLEHDVATRVGARGAPPFAVEASMRACAATLESIVLPLRQVWLGYAVRPGLSFPPRGRVGSPAQSAQISAAPTPWAASTGIDGDEGMPLECFLAFCADAGLVTHMGHHNLASIFVDSLEGMYDPSLDSGSEQPVLSFPAFQVAIVRLAAHLWDMRAHPSVRASPWPRPLHGTSPHRRTLHPARAGGGPLTAWRRLRNTRVARLPPCARARAQAIARAPHPAERALVSARVPQPPVRRLVHADLAAHARARARVCPLSLSRAVPRGPRARAAAERWVEGPAAQV